jgi:hypothetical protein
MKISAYILCIQDFLLITKRSSTRRLNYCIFVEYDLDEWSKQEIHVVKGIVGVPQPKLEPLRTKQELALKGTYMLVMGFKSC